MEREEGLVEAGENEIREEVEEEGWRRTAGEGRERKGVEKGEKKEWLNEERAERRE